MQKNYYAPFVNIAIIYQINPFCLQNIILDPKNHEEHVPPHNDALFIIELIDNYFKGLTITTPWQLLDMNNYTLLQQKVFRAVSEIPFGTTCSYKDVAKLIGSPKAFRFVGTTLSKNKFPVIIPCHRVIKSDNSFGKFTGGIELKRKMIEFEKNNKVW